MRLLLHKNNARNDLVVVSTNTQSSASSSSFSIANAQLPMPQSLKIGEWLIAKKWITQDHLTVALKEQKRKSKRLGELMVDLGFLTADQLLMALTTLSGLPSISLSKHILDPLIVRRLPYEIASTYQLIFFQDDANSIHLAMADPEDLVALDKVRECLGLNTDLIPYHTTMSEIAQALEIYYPQPTIDAHEGEVVRLINDLILEAVRLRASDIHLSPNDHRIDINFRLDGIIYTAHTLHKERWAAISVRLKIMAGLDIAESRRPQSGRFSLTLGGREFDFRLSSHPIIHGENFVLRILDKTQSLRSVDELGFEDNDVQLLKKLVHLPNGMFLICGPTGSGKTTTLYALLSHMNAPTRNIMTLEEPVEYCLTSIHQTEIREDGPFRFDEGIRSLLRQDPDVILISEIRDKETAQMALRAAITGHLVLGTIHAKDSFTIPQRLQDLGIDSNFLSGNLVAGMTQRLVRRLCEVCRHPKIVTSEDRRLFRIEPSVTHVYQATGCESCFYTGYYGREAVAEITLFNNNITKHFSNDWGPSALEKIAKQQGLSTLRERAIKKVLSGKTTFTELERVIGI
jgi:type II secretory ATPase GspE/PulE/Tfp pilus assembly ATPase PilB-like protein